MVQNRYITVLLAKKLLAPGVWELTFAKPDGYTFEAGQFCQFFISKPEGEIVRLYSIGSAPAEESLKFFVKLVPGGQASQYFGGLKGGEEVKIGVAMGRFTVPPSFVGLTMIATGVGAAPFFGFIKDQLDFKKSAKKFRLIFGVRSEEDLFWQEELEAYRKKYNNFTYTITLSQPKNPDSWTGSVGRVTGHLEGLDMDHDFYVCGSPAMVMDVRKILLENKINTKKIHLEAF